MLKSYKTEIYPTTEQVCKINQTMGVCRYVYNLYITTQQTRRINNQKIQSAIDFSKWLNNEYIPQHDELLWIKDVSSKSVKQSINNAYRAYQNFFNKKSKFPKFKTKKKSNVKMYFVRDSKTSVIPCERHRIKIPTLGWIRLKEKGYIPTTKSGLTIISGTISYKAGRYYISVLIDIPNNIKSINYNQGIGIDLGIKDLAICSNGVKFSNINNIKKIQYLETKLHREQRSLARMYQQQSNKKSTQSNIQKQIMKIQILHQRLDNIRTDYINKTIAEIVKTKPSYITIENLNISWMLKNKYLAKAISQQKLYEFSTK